MGLFSIEHSKAAYRADFAVYAAAIVVLAFILVAQAPHAKWFELLVCTAAGLAGWTLLEYGLHRFVLHGLPPFSRWHVQHHLRPSALICAPTLLSASLIAGLIFAPALLASDAWHALAITLGVLAGYLAYAITHHATHHWRADNAWLRQRKRCHALHHRPGAATDHYGVTTEFWDRICGSRRRAVTPPA